MEKTYIIVFRFFFMNFVSSCVWYIHDEPLCTGYAPGVFSHSRDEADEEGSKG
jgi:hypothetical protein